MQTAYALFDKRLPLPKSLEEPHYLSLREVPLRVPLRVPLGGSKCLLHVTYLREQCKGLLVYVL